MVSVNPAASILAKADAHHSNEAPPRNIFFLEILVVSPGQKAKSFAMKHCLLDFKAFGESEQ
ncbi:MAG: hypothetical protein KGJ60_10885 [Verrucomicrobiota bacterium]|nr:hypothetical protein [Verrucomicrobiota bacterium]